MLPPFQFLPPKAVALFLAVWSLTAACGDSDAAASPSDSESGRDRRLVEVYQALEAGLPDAARTLLDQYGEAR